MDGESILARRSSRNDLGCSVGFQRLADAGESKPLPSNGFIESAPQCRSLAFRAQCDLPIKV